MFQQADSPAGRREFAWRTEASRRVEVTVEYRKIRRGWYYGEERRESAEDKAVRLVAAGMAEAGWQPSDLATRRKADPVKIALARRLRQETTMPLKWICDQLEMGSWKSINRRFYEDGQAKY